MAITVCTTQYIWRCNEVAPSFHLFIRSEITVLHSGQVFSLLNHKVMHSSQNICCKGMKNQILHITLQRIQFFQVFERASGPAVYKWVSDCFNGRATTSVLTVPLNCFARCLLSVITYLLSGNLLAVTMKYGKEPPYTFSNKCCHWWSRLVSI